MFQMIISLINDIKFQKFIIRYYDFFNNYMHILETEHQGTLKFNIFISIKNYINIQLEIKTIYCLNH